MESWKTSQVVYSKVAPVMQSLHSNFALPYCVSESFKNVSIFSFYETDTEKYEDLY